TRDLRFNARLRDEPAERGGLLYAAERIRCGKLRSSSRADGTTTSAHRNTNLSMSLQRTGFADRDAFPRGASGSGVRLPGHTPKTEVACTRRPAQKSAANI